MMIVIAQQKGGVGKTTTALNVSVCLANQGRGVLVVDTDPQFTMTRQLGIEVRSRSGALGVAAKVSPESTWRRMW